MKRFLAGVSVVIATFSAQSAFAETCYYGTNGFSNQNPNETWSISFDSGATFIKQPAGIHNTSDSSAQSNFDTYVTPQIPYSSSGSWTFNGNTVISPQFNSVLPLPATLTVIEDASGVLPGYWWGMFAFSLDKVCIPDPVIQTGSGNVLIQLANSVFGHAVTGSQDLASGDTGQVIVGFLAIALLLTLAWYVRRTYGKSKG